MLSDAAAFLLFIGLQWGCAAGAWLWIRWAMKRDSKAQREARQ